MFNRQRWGSGGALIYSLLISPCEYFYLGQLETRTSLNTASPVGESLSLRRRGHLPACTVWALRLHRGVRAGCSSLLSGSLGPSALQIRPGQSLGRAAGLGPPESPAPQSKLKLRLFLFQGSKTSRLSSPWGQPERWDGELTLGPVGPSSKMSQPKSQNCEEPLETSS